ncbi:hypothetical protein AK812_SmicGene25157 [Symbiodinium microadriaticum]|uniref:J domain-containing protein n=1 Tax=Symbiodinium microadriaticum TaxID=2951 RepID=A0A1Q9DCV1_SYMMI|nr:hypothetical protein AK812_SmicGene25157 [Symbiodinium microadriaticum]
MGWRCVGQSTAIVSPEKPGGASCASFAFGEARESSSTAWRKSVLIQRNAWAANGEPSRKSKKKSIGDEALLRAGMEHAQACEPGREMEAANGAKPAPQDDDSLLAPPPGRWTDSFLILKVEAQKAIIIGGENLDSRGKGAYKRNTLGARRFAARLGVARDARTADVKRAYKTMAKRWHPDKIAVAYETLPGCPAGQHGPGELRVDVPQERALEQRLVTFSNDVWIVQASFHPFWENQIQKYQHLVRFGRIDVTDDQAKWLPLKVLPTVLKFGRHLGAVEIFPVTQMHETPQALTKFVLTSFPNIGLPLSSDRDESIRRIPPRLCSFAAGAALPFLVSGGPECADIMVAQISSVLFAIPGKSEEERYKSHLVPRKLAAQWSEVFEVRSAETELLHALPVKAALPKEASGQAAALLFPAHGGGTEPRAAAAFSWPTGRALLRAAAPRRCSAPRSAPPLSASLRGEEEMVLELMRFTEMVGVSLSVQSLLPGAFGFPDRRLGASGRRLGPARDLQESRATYQGEVAQIRESGGEVAEDEARKRELSELSDGGEFERLGPSAIKAETRLPGPWSEDARLCEVERALAGSSAFLMDLDTHRLAPLRLSLSSFKGLYPQIAYEDSLNWVEALEIRSLPDCSEGVRQRFVRQLSQSSFTELLWQLMPAPRSRFSLFLLEVIAKALASGSVLWWLGASGMVVATLSRHSEWESGRSPPFLRLPELASYVPEFLLRELWEWVKKKLQVKAAVAYGRAAQAVFHYSMVPGIFAYGLWYSGEFTLDPMSEPPGDFVRQLLKKAQGHKEEHEIVAAN